VSADDVGVIRHRWLVEGVATIVLISSLIVIGMLGALLWRSSPMPLCTATDCTPSRCEFDVWYALNEHSQSGLTSAEKRIYADARRREARKGSEEASAVVTWECQAKFG